MHIADHTSLKNDGIGVPKVRSVSVIHDILIRGEPSYQSEMFFLVDQETALKLVPLQMFRGPLKMENDAGSERFLVHSYCCNSNFPESRKKQKKAQCL